MIGSNPPSPTFWSCERSRDRVWTVSHNKNRNRRAFPMCLISYYRKKASITSLGPFQRVIKSSIFLLENELLAKHREGVSLTHSYCFFDSSIPIYELWIQFGILRRNSCCQRGS